MLGSSSRVASARSLGHLGGIFLLFFFFFYFCSFPLFSTPSDTLDAWPPLAGGFLLWYNGGATMLSLSEVVMNVSALVKELGAIARQRELIKQSLLSPQAKSKLLGELAGREVALERLLGGSDGLGEAIADEVHRGPR